MTMEQQTRRYQIGYQDFEKIRQEGRVYIDKTEYVYRMTHGGPRYIFLIRPRRFGKSIFLSMLRDYYDMSRQDRFDKLFGGMWIAEHPTREKGKYRYGMLTMTGTHGTHVDIPQGDVKFFKELMDKMGWKYETKEGLIQTYLETRPAHVDLSEDDIMGELYAVRYAL